VTDDLAQRFEEHRGRLRAIAYRILASPSEADDAVQEAWLRFSRSNTAGVDDLGSWLTTVVSRVCLNMLQARKSRPQPPADANMPEPAGVSDPARQAELVDAFLGAARTGDFDALLALLDPDVVLRADKHAVALGAAAESRGAEQVAEFSRYARGGRRAALDGTAALVWMPGGRLRVVWAFTTTRNRITAIELIADPARFPELDLVIAADE
jgi:RNA polymerase sigma-70 factor (ECF subfamily)